MAFNSPYSDQTILLIEDNFADVLLFQQVLSREGIRNPVQVVSDGSVAIKYLEGQAEYQDRDQFPLPWLIFADLMLPRVNGFELTEWLRQHPRYGNIPVIVLTGVKEGDNVNRAYDVRANSVLVKPHGLDKWQALIKSAFTFWSMAELPRIPAAA